MDKGVDRWPPAVLIPIAVRHRARDGTILLAMIQAELIGEAGSALRLVFAVRVASGNRWATCEIAADAEDGETWTTSNFRLSRRDALALVTLCRARPGVAGYDAPFESELQTWLVSRWEDTGTAVLEVGVRSEASDDEESADGLDFMIRTTPSALASFGDQVAAGVEFALGSPSEP